MLGASQTFSGVAFSLACAYNSPIREVCQLFSGACSLLVPLISVCGITNSLVLPQVIDSLLSSVVPQVSKVCQFHKCSESVKKETSHSDSPLKIHMLDAHSTLFFPSQERSHKSVYSDHGELCQFLSVVLQILWCCHKLLSFPLFSVTPDTQDMVVPDQHSTSGETETSFSGSPQKAGMLDIHSTLLFLSQGRIHKWDFSS